MGNGVYRLLSDGDQLVAEATEACLDIAIPRAPDFRQYDYPPHAG